MLDQALDRPLDRSLDQSSTAVATAAPVNAELQSWLRSPVLNQFRLNPFRVLHIPLDIPTEEAIWKAQDLAALRRAGIESPDAETLPWLTPADEYELNQVVQAIEEPLRRLKEQFFWFDFQHDSAAEQLQAILANPTSAEVAEYLATPVELRVYVAPAPGAPPGSSLHVPNENRQPSPESQAQPQAQPQSDPQSGAATSPGLVVVKCSNCGRSVVPKSDGTCPSCQNALAVPAAAQPAKSVGEAKKSSSSEPFVCPHCNKSVVAYGNGLCPHCWGQLPAAAAPAAAAPQAIEPSNNNGKSVVTFSSFGALVAHQESADGEADKAMAAQPVAPAKHVSTPANGSAVAAAAVARTQAAADAAAAAKMKERLPAAARALNQANLSLLWAALVTHRFADFAEKNSPKLESKDVPAAEAISWATVEGVRFVDNPHEHCGSDEALRQEIAELERAWADAVKRWSRLLKSEEYYLLIQHAITQLDDELVGEDDLEMIADAVGTQFSDLLLNELKLQVIDGRYDRVEMLLRSIASGELDLRKWSMAFRPLRSLFETELRELQVLAEQQPQKVQNLAIFLDRLATLSGRWSRLDADGVLGLGQMVDDRLRSVFNGLKEFVDLAVIAKIIPLFERMRDLASAHSLKQEIEAFLATIRDTSEWECFYCRVREGEIDRCVVLSGKKETHRVRRGNTTTIYYKIQRALLPRCRRCAELHVFFRKAARCTWIVFLPACLQLAYYFFLTYSEWDCVIRVAAVAGAYWASGYVVRSLLAVWLTHSGERKYSESSHSKPYRDLKKEGFSVTPDYGFNAVAAVRKK